MQLFVEQFVSVVVLATGLSHAIQPGLWVELFRDLFARPYAALYIGVFTVPLGLFVVLTHNVWVADLPVLVTVMGWGWTVKSCVYLVWPGALEKWREKATGPRAKRNYLIAGAFMAAIGLVLVWHSFFRRPLLPPA